MFLLIREKKKEDFRYYPPLNSIMFLLIQKLKNISTGEQTALNSIMFLLIQKIQKLQQVVFQNFKFHYVSINSNVVTRLRQAVRDL